MSKCLILLSAFAVFCHSSPVSAGVLNWLFPPGEQLVSRDSKNNANDKALGPVLSQGNTEWCFGYVAADLVSQELGVRVSPGQIIYNHLNRFRTLAFNEFVGTGGYPDKAIREQMKKGFCPHENSSSLQLQSWVENRDGKQPSQLDPQELAYRSGQCTDPIKLKKASAQIQNEFWSETPREWGNPKGINLLNRLDDLIDRERIAGFSYSTAKNWHIISITGRICGDDKIKFLQSTEPKAFAGWDAEIATFQHCIYMVRNSGAPAQKYLSANAIAKWGRELVWID